MLVFHLDPSWLPGGFLGVDVFFVVSGFLITTLLVRERVTTGAIDLPGFWSRRARRLLPALLVCVPASVLLARLSEGDLLVGIERQVLGAFTFTSNWLEIGAGSDYFAATSPQLLMNLWSLAVEEQFYLLWPLAVLGLLALTRRPEVRAACGTRPGGALRRADGRPARPRQPHPRLLRHRHPRHRPDARRRARLRVRRPAPRLDHVDLVDGAPPTGRCRRAGHPARADGAGR